MFTSRFHLLHLVFACFISAFTSMWVLTANPWSSSEIVPVTIVSDAIAFCKPHGDLFYIETVRFKKKFDNDKIVCLDESSTLYKYIKDLPKK